MKVSRKLRLWRKAASKKGGSGIFLLRSKSRTRQRVEKGAKVLGRAEASFGAFKWLKTRGVVYGGAGAAGYYTGTKPKEKRKRRS